MSGDGVSNMELVFSEGKINLYFGVGLLYLGKFLFQKIQEERNKIEK
jgi:hypothetical protein